MADPWRVLDFSDFHGRIRSVKGGIVVENDMVTRSIPASDIAVVLIGVKTIFSAGVIHRLTGNGAAVIFCNWRRIPVAAAYPWSNHTRVGARQRAQSVLSLPRKKHAWQRLVRAKIRGQAANFLRNQPATHARLKQLAKDVRSGDPDNIEAQAARITWQQLMGDDFVRQPGLGVGANALFDYGYSVVRGRVLREVIAAGLNPALGVHHRGRGNQFALVDDLIEPFRPAVDSVIQTIGPEVTIDDPEIKKEPVAVVSKKMSHTTDTVATTITNLARDYGMYVEGQRKQLSVPVWGGEHWI